MQQTGAMEVKANAQLGAHQRGVAESAKGAPEVARKSGDDRLEKRTTLLTNTELWTTISMVENVLFIISSLVVVIGLAGLTSTLLAGLNERRRELSILRSVGAGPRDIFLMLVLEGVVITALGIILGYLLLFVAIELLGSLPQLMFGLVLSQGLPSNQEWLLIFAIFLTGIFSSLFPGWRAWRISLADGLTPRL